MAFNSGQLDPFSSPESWDVVMVANTNTPGVAELSGFARPFGWEVKKGKGAKGSTVTLNDYPPAKGTLTLRFWTQDHFIQWAEFRAIWNYDPTKKPVAAVDIFHPSLADLGIDRVVCEEISAVEKESPGLYKVVIKLIEYNPPPKKPAVATPDGSTTKKSDVDNDDPATKVRLEKISSLTAELNAPATHPKNGLDLLR